MKEMKNLKGAMVNVQYEKGAGNSATLKIVSTETGETITIRSGSVEASLRTLILDLNEFLAQTDSALSSGQLANDRDLRNRMSERRMIAGELQVLKKPR